MTPRPIRTTIDPGPEDGLLREALSHWASGVAIVAVRDDEDVDALTVSAFTPLSLRPPLVLVSLDENSSLLTTLLDRDRFVVNLLPEGAQRTAGMVASRGPLNGVPFPAEGDPILADALAAFVCRLRESHPAGDHRIVIGEVEDVRLGPEAGPLLYYRRDYRTLGRS